MKTATPSPPDLAPRPGKTAPAFKGDGWWTIQEACQFFDMRPAQLRGLIARSELGDPLGRLVTVDGKTFDAVYPFSVERYIRRNLQAETRLNDCPMCSVGNPGTYVKDGRMICPHRPE